MKKTITKQSKIPGMKFWCERCHGEFEDVWCRRFDKSKDVVEFTFICEDCIQDDKANS